MPDIYIPLVTPPADRAEPAVWLAFRKGEVVVVRDGDQPALPCCVDLAEHGLAPQRHHYLGLYGGQDRKSTRLNSSHSQISYAVFCLKKKKKKKISNEV